MSNVATVQRSGQGLPLCDGVGTEASREWRRFYQIGILKWSAQGVSA
jgi:hypothetical protein